MPYSHHCAPIKGQLVEYESLDSYSENREQWIGNHIIKGKKKSPPLVLWERWGSAPLFSQNLVMRERWLVLPLVVNLSVCFILTFKCLFYFNVKKYITKCFGGLWKNILQSVLRGCKKVFYEKMFYEVMKKCFTKLWKNVLRGHEKMF